MRTSRFRLLTLFFALLVIAAVSASAGSGTTLARGKPAPKPVKPTVAKTLPKLDLATYDAKRWIVQLKGAPLASYGLGIGSLRTTNTALTESSGLRLACAL